MPSSETVLSWNVANWITILLMVAIGFSVLGFLAKLYHSKNSQ